MTRSTGIAYCLLALAAWATAASAAAPKGRYIVDETRGTVLDTRTKLMWQRDGTFSAETPAVARTHCQGLTLAGFSDGWRLPTRSELLSIVDASTFSPSIDEAAFPRTKTSWYWTTTRPASGRDDAWIVSFYDGNADYDHFDAVPPFNVRCVR